MFNELFRKCEEIYYTKKETCCRFYEQQQCDCSLYLRDQFFSKGIDYYECKNKLNYYVLNYGASYISEIYYYLSTSKLLNNFNNSVNILSLGCGFAPDYFAFNKYIEDEHLGLKFNYFGLDNSKVWEDISWKGLELRTDNPAKFNKKDLTEQNIDLEFYNYDIIFLSKIYSTIRRNNANTINFLNNIVRNVQNMKINSVLIFHDINNISEGRDDFDDRIRNNFESQNIKRFYTCVSSPYSEENWKEINGTSIIYQDLIPKYDYNIPLQIVSKTIFFEYWKK